MKCYLGETCVQCHSRMISILGKVQVRSSSQLFFNDQGLFKQLEPAGQELVLDLQEVALAHVHLKGLIDDGETVIVLDILPTTIAVSDNA